MYLVDVQGTLIDDKERKPIHGAVDFIASLNKNAIPYVLVTNNTKYSSDEFKRYLRGCGFEFSDASYIDPLMCLREYIGAGSIAAIGSDGFVKTLHEQGYEFRENPDFLVLSLKENISYDDMATAVETIQGGAKLVAMHSTAVYAKHGRKYPGLGAITKCLEFATATTAQIVGKPSELFYKKAIAMLGAKGSHGVTIVSDDAIGDLVGAKRMGMHTVFVLSGKYENTQQITPFLRPNDMPDCVIADVSQIKIGA